MAENTSTSTTTTAKKPAAAKRTPKAKAAAKRKPAARRTTATTPSRTTGRRVRTQAKNETRTAASAQARAARITAEQGKAFCDAVVSLGGIEALNRAWAGPEALPTLAELDDALGWLARTERVEPAF